MSIQCAIPAFECLLPTDDNEAVMDLLFLMATFHAYVKLRLHTESTVESLEIVTTALCQALRRFSTDVCPRYQTNELPREVAARVRRQTSATKSSTSSSRNNHASPSVPLKRKVFNMNTTKIHSLPDYPAYIQRFGTTDSYTTQTVSFGIITLCITLTSHRVNWLIAFPKNGTPCQIKTRDTLHRSQLRKFENGSIWNSKNVWMPLVPQ